MLSDCSHYCLTRPLSQGESLQAFPYQLETLQTTGGLYEAITVQPVFWDPVIVEFDVFFHDTAYFVDLLHKLSRKLAL